MTREQILNYPNPTAEDAIFLAWMLNKTNPLSSHFKFMKANANLLRTEDVTEQIAREREEICNLLFGVWNPEPQEAV